MWTLYACLREIFRVGHVDPLCMFDENIRSWSCGPSMIIKYSELVMWPLSLCMFNKLHSELVMWTLYACYMKDIQSWSCGPSMHVL